jgi:hypothetical protein
MIQGATMYQLQRNQAGDVASIRRLEDGACIPLADGNRDYADYLAWVDAGNTAAEDPAYTLDGAKERKNDEINAARLTANRSTFTAGGKIFACDELSRSDIDGINGYVTLFGALPAGWPGGWKAVDNSYLPIASVNDWKAFFGAMVAAGNANFAKAQQLKAQLAAAKTFEQVDAIQW